DLSVTLGGSGGANHGGGDVDLTMEGSALTQGEGAPALLLQSIGGGGGAARLGGNARTAATVGGSDGAQGDGGTVKLDLAGDVRTTGARAHGILAQSIGGGGGAVLTDGDVEQVVLSDANGGTGGAIALDIEGGVVVDGNDTFGIVAQSLGGGGGFVDGDLQGTAGGTGAGGTIALSVSGEVSATGENGTAIFAQSTGEGAAGGDITVSVNAAISGGAGTGRAIKLDGGALNRVRLGDTALVTSLSGMAIEGSSGADVVTSTGELFGNVALGAGANRYENEAGGMLRTDTALDLGSDGVLRNAGVMVIGGERIEAPAPATFAARAAVAGPRFAENVAQTTELNGSFEAEDTSVLHLDAAFRVDGESGDGGDLLSATGSAVLDGEVQATLLSLERAQPLAFITGVAGVTDAGTEIADTAAIDFSIGTGVDASGVAALTLIATPDFSLEGMTTNQSRLGDHLNAVLGGEGSAELGDLMAFIGNQTSEAAVIDILDRLSPEGYAVNALATLNAGRAFSQTVLDCAARETGAQTVGDGNCIWLEAEGSFLDQSADGFDPVSVETLRIAMGAEFRIDPDLSLGIAGGWEDLSLTSGDRFRSSGERVHLGVGLAQETGALSLGATLSGSYGSYESIRVVGIDGNIAPGRPFTAGTGEADHHLGQMTLRGTARYEFAASSLPVYAAPQLDLDTTYLVSFDGQERGLGATGVRLEETQQLLASATPSLELGVRTEALGLGIGGFVRAGVAVFSDDEVSQDAALIGSPGSAGDFRSSAALDQVTGLLDVGLTVEAPGQGVGLRLGYGGSFGEASEAHSLSAGFQVKF
ncbi:MAG: hypothetical protein AAFQ51_09210, partial [Pseudomonadota bacterium]